jgi:protoheme IX farnesyltransferase
MLFTVVVGMLLSTHGPLPWRVLIFGSLGIGLVAGAAAAINHLVDRHVDAIMARTRGRPLPRGTVSAAQVLGFAASLGGAGMWLLLVFANGLCAALTFASLIGYAVVYSMFLKHATPQNIVIGGAAGAFPPMIGWACVTNSVTIESTVLFLIIFLWTPAHFWALALFKMRDYEAVGVPMLPNVSGERTTKHQIVAYAVLTAICAVLPTFLGFASVGYGVVAAALGAVFIYCSIAVWRMPDGDLKMIPAKKLFGFSIFYLFAVFSALMLDRLVAMLASYAGGSF